MIEEHADQAVGVKTYADYIATRPRAEHFGSHALFTDDGVPVQLSKVSEELNQHQGNIWTAIVSMRREDAARLGYDHGERWRDMLRTQTQTISEAFRIPIQNLKWFAAFHNESHHPHVHMIIYSDVPSEGFLSKAGVQKLRSSFARDVFAEDLTSVYSQQTGHRDELRTKSRELIAEIVSDINRNVYDNPKVENLLLQLAIRLSKTSGKKVYGFLKPDVKALVDSIVDELSADSRIKKLYDLWYQQREEVLHTYTDEMPMRVPLSQNKEFKPIKNAVIQEAMNLVLNQIPDDDPIESDDFAATEPRDPPLDAPWMNLEDPEEAVPWLEIASTQGDSWAQYLLGKMLTSLVEALPEIITAIVAAIPKIIDNIINAVLNAIPQIIQAGIQLLISLIQALPQIITTIVQAIPQIISGIVNALIGNIDKIIMAGVQLFVALIQNLPTIIVEICKAVPQIVSGIVSAFGSLMGKIVEIGGNIVKGLWQGIQQLASWLWDKVSGWISSIWNGILDFFGIHSPSKEMAWVGQMLVKGLSGSIEDNGDEAVKAAEAMSEDIDDVMQGLAKDMSTALPTNFDIDGSVGGAIASAADGVGRTSGFSLQLNIATFNNYSSDDIEQLTNEIMVTAGQFAKRKGVVFA